MTTGERIRLLRTEKGLSQEGLADALDVTRQAVSRWETDASLPDIDKLIGLCDLFGVSLDYLVRGKEPAVGLAEEESESADTPAQTYSLPISRTTIAGILCIVLGISAAPLLIFAFSPVLRVGTLLLASIPIILLAAAEEKAFPALELLGTASGWNTVLSHPYVPESVRSSGTAAQQYGGIRVHGGCMDCVCRSDRRYDAVDGSALPENRLGKALFPMVSAFGGIVSVCHRAVCPDNPADCGACRGYGFSSSVAVPAVLGRCAVADLLPCVAVFPETGFAGMIRAACTLQNKKGRDCFRRKSSVHSLLYFFAVTVRTGHSALSRLQNTAVRSLPL